MATVGDRIREIREKKNWTQDQLADKAKLSKGFLSDVENNKKNISSQFLLKIANALGASVDFLLVGETKKNTAQEAVVIPPSLSQAAEELNLSYSDTLELLNAHNSVIARRSNKSIRDFAVDDWKKFHKAIKEVFD
jgi:transcriptional regulator with XRE-family HTH domain